MTGGTLARLAENSMLAVDSGIYGVDRRMERCGTGFARALDREEGAAIISEIKFSSPSQGMIRRAEDPVGIATEMVAGGASALSVLTQPHLFGGSPEYFMKVREAIPGAHADEGYNPGLCPGGGCPQDGGRLHAAHTGHLRCRIRI